MRAAFRIPLRRAIHPVPVARSCRSLAELRGVRAPLLFKSNSPVRAASTSPPPPQPLPHRPAPHRNPDEPVYELHFTCKACQHRSAHTVSKQAYHNGSVLITCPGCKNRHLISDHLKIFSDSAITLEDILAKEGQVLHKGAIDEKGDVEFWPSGTDQKQT